MSKWFATAAFALALGTAALSPSVAQTHDQTAPMMRMMGGGCPTMGMMGQGMMGGRQAGMGAMVDPRC
jgi:hypothetical protein